MSLHLSLLLFSFFFFTDPATTEIYTLSLHDALPISNADNSTASSSFAVTFTDVAPTVVSLAHDSISTPENVDRKSTRLNSSHVSISYAVFCLKKKTVGHGTRSKTTTCLSSPPLHLHS